MKKHFKKVVKTKAPDFLIHLIIWVFIILTITLPFTKNENYDIIVLCEIVSFSIGSYLIEYFWGREVYWVETK